MEGLGTAIETEPLVMGTVSKLYSDLDPTLYYHCPEHTVDVLKQALRLAHSDNLGERDILLLAIAAAFHDAGFLEQRPKNEPIGARMASEAMKATKRFTIEERNLVNQMILDTQLVMDGPAQIANSRLSPWLLDADLANLGRVDFWEQTKRLSRELSIDMETMLPMTRNLMERHNWQSPAGARAFATQKENNLAALELEMRQFG